MFNRTEAKETTIGIHIILGASDQAGRASFTAAHMLQKAGYNWVPVGRRNGEIFGKNILPIAEKPHFDQVHTITLYLNPTIQETYYDYILTLKPHLIIFNPGTENPILMDLCQQHGIQATVACTLVLLSLKQY